MNKVEELHDNANQGQILAKLVSGQSRTREANAHAKVTEGVACKFKEWCEQSKHRYYHNKPFSPYTTSELYQEFIKTL